MAEPKFEFDWNNLHTKVEVEKDGKVETVTIANAFDLIKHNGYKLVGAVEEEQESAPVVEASSVPGLAAAQAAAAAPGPESVTEPATAPAEDKPKRGRPAKKTDDSTR